MADTGKMKKGSAAGRPAKKYRKKTHRRPEAESPLRRHRTGQEPPEDPQDLSVQKGESRLRDEITAILLIAAGACF